MNREVHNWLQKHSKFSHDQTPRGQVTRKIQVYRRRENSIRSGFNENSGVILRDSSPSKEKYVDPVEYVRKLKGIQPSANQSTIESEQEFSTENVWERGECSHQLEDVRMSFVPISSEGDVTSEQRSHFSGETNKSRNSLDVWSSLKGYALEEQAIIWIMRNLVYMGKSLGLRREGNRTQALQITQGAEGRQDKEGVKNSRTSSRSKGMREINRLKSEVNYERKGPKRVRRKIEIGKVSKGGAVSF